MRIWREASNTAALRFSPAEPQRSADFVKRPWASRSVAESFSERSATVRASAECVRFPFAVLKRMELEVNSQTRITGARQPAASAAEKSSWKKYPRPLTSTKWEQAEYRFHEPATGFGRSRAVLHLAPTALLQADVATGCEPSLFWVGQVRPLALGRLTRNRRLVTT